MADILAFEGVSIEHRGRRGGTTRILDDVSFSIAGGEALALVGESGCGKSTVAFAAMRHLPAGMRITRGRILLEGRDLASLSGRELQGVRGSRIAMVYQDPASSLNPVMTVGRQLTEVATLHAATGAVAARAQVDDMLAQVRLADPEAIMERYPHQLSGGQQQRIVIAMALMAKPALLVLDEPTTGLDVTIEAAILELVRDLRQRLGTAVLFISHNFGTVARIAERISVLYAGRMIESGPVRDVLLRPAHPYSRGLIAALPRLNGLGRAGRLVPIDGIITAADRARTGCAFAPRCPHTRADRCDEFPIPLDLVGGNPSHAVRCARQDVIPPPDSAQASERRAAPQQTAAILEVEGLTKNYRSHGIFASSTVPTVHALAGADLSARRGQTLAIVGESGSGKSTLARIIAGLIPASGGSARFAGTDLATTTVDARTRELRGRIQMVFQNPDSTLNPRHTIEHALSRPLIRLKGLSRRDALIGVRRLMERVSLPVELARRLPEQLSGGQRQRVAIARALAGEPDLLIADEPVSALDVSVQAAIVNLLADLQSESEIALVLISHDLALVRHMADWVAVMYLGRVVELGPADEVLSPPHHPYTAALLAAAPRPDPAAPPPSIILEGAMPSPTVTIKGCPFASRCPVKVGPECDLSPPPVRRRGHHTIACHIEQFGLPAGGPSL